MKKQLFLLVMMLLPLVASAYDFLVDGYYYNIVSVEDKTVSLAGAEEFSGNVVIPGEIIVGNYTFKVISIDDNVGSYSPNISSITISEGIEKIGKKCFFSTDWNFMSFIKYPSTLKETGKEAFGCTKPTFVYIHDLASWINVKFDLSYPLIGEWYGHNENRQYKRLCIGGVECPDIVIPEGISKIPQNTFYEANILSVTFPSTMRTVEGFNNSYMERVYFSNENDSISSNAFNGCRYLENVSSPNKITYIGEWSFSYCVKLESFTINEGVENIFNGTFYNCASLKKVKIPSTCKTIGDKAFYGCTKLDSIILGKELKLIGKSTFDACPSTLRIICYSAEPPSIDESSFTSGQYLMATVIVPAGSKEAYATATGWKNFANIIDKEIYSLTYIVDGQVYKKYDLEVGTPITPEPEPIKEGYSFSGWNDIPQTMPDHDVIVTGTFAYLPLCETPTIFYENGKLKYECATEDVEFVTDITDVDVKTHYDALIPLTATYNIKVYARKEGFNNSRTVTATLCWIDQQPASEGIADGVTNVSAKAVLIKNVGGLLTVEGANEGEQIKVYSIDGTLVGSAICNNGSALVNTNQQLGNVAIVNIGKKSVKVILK